MQKTMKYPLFVIFFTCNGRTQVKTLI